MKKLLSYAFIVALMFGLVACGNSSNSPEGAVKGFFTALAKNDVDGAMKLMDMQGVKEADMGKAKDKIKFMFGMMVDKAKEEGVNFADVKVGEVVYSDDKKSAKVEVTMPGKNGKEEKTKVPVVNRDGTWKVLLK